MSMHMLGRSRLTALMAACAACSLGAGSPIQHDDHSANASSWDIFTNHGSYMPRTHCIVDEQGRADWPWIAILITLTAGVIAAYACIYYFWIKTHRAQKSQDRNKKMFELANIFFWCAICGYGFSIVSFAWPAYRLLAGALLLLNIWSWKFILTDLAEFKQTLCSKAMERELREQLQERNRCLERDVKERTRELEYARQRAEDANIAKSRFLATMSHEIRTPMTAIMGFTEILTDEMLGKNSTDEAREAVDTIHSNCQHLLMIIDDVLDVSKIEAGRMTTERVATKPIDLIESIISLQTPRATFKLIELVVSYESEIPEIIESDPTRLRQILLNLVSNAIKFTQGGRITLCVNYDAYDDTLCFRIVDSGVGMSPEQLELVRQFDAFNQADSTTTRMYGGTGLGLKISAELTKLLGGTLTLDSRLGKGTVATLRVPTGGHAAECLISPTDINLPTKSHNIQKRQSTNAETKPLVADNSKLQSINVLLAEDGLDNQRLITHILKSHGANVTIASNGQEALDQIEKHGFEAFDVVLMDIQMPHVDGYEATRRLRAKGYTRPILALTAHAMQNSRVKAINAGCYDYLTKPIDKHALVAAVARWAFDHPRRAVA